MVICLCAIKCHFSVSFFFLCIKTEEFNKKRTKTILSRNVLKARKETKTRINYNKMKNLNETKF